MSEFNVSLIMGSFSFDGPEAKTGAIRLRLFGLAGPFIISGDGFARSSLVCVDVDGEAFTAPLAGVILQLLHAEDEPITPLPGQRCADCSNSRFQRSVVSG
jgi:hypothetical protein